MLPGMKLQQGQLWKLEDHYVRIVVLERLAVEYKTIKDLNIWEGTRHRVTKKEFCRMVKHGSIVDKQGAEPLPPTTAEIPPTAPAAPVEPGSPIEAPAP